MSAPDPVIRRSDELERDRGMPLRAPAVVLPDDPLVSVVMTTWNSLAWIDTAIASVLAQDGPRLELIVVDDASTDGTLDHLLRRAVTEPRLRVLAMDFNAGTYCAKNQGMRHARGDVVTFMDSDDEIAPDRLRKQLDLLRRPGLVATTCNYVRRDAAGEIVLNRGLAERQALISLMIKRAVIDEVGWFDSVRTSADDEYFERIRLVYGRAAHANVAEPLYSAMLRESSLTTSSGTATRLDAADGDITTFLSAARVAYLNAYRAWHAALTADGRRPYMPPWPSERPFEVEAPLRMRRTAA